MVESERKVVLLRHAPSEPETVGALRLAASLRALGHRVTLVLIQDAVLGALRHSQVEGARQLRAVVEAGADCRYLAGDLAMRGHGSTSVSPGCEGCSYEELVDVLLADDSRVIGAF